METATQERTSRSFDPSALLDSDPTSSAFAVTQRVIGTLTELSIAAAKENARLAAELQISALDALLESQSAALRWQPTWGDGLADPLRLYQRAFMETVESTQRTLTFMGVNARLVVQAADRMQAASTDAGRRIRELLTSGVHGAREAARRG